VQNGVTRTLATALLAAAILGAKATDVSSEPTTLPGRSWEQCQGSDQAWVRRAILALTGRRSWSQAEVNAYEDVAREGAPSGHDASRPGATLSPGRRRVAEALMASDDFRLRWSDFLMDALHVVRREDKSQKNCYGSPAAAAVDDGSLARWVREHDATDKTPPVAGFKMRELLSSALELDDLSVVYRAHMFAMMSRPIYGANLDAVGRERSRRQDFAGVFDSVYVHRDLVCLACHNSEYSKTFDRDPEKSRAWPTPGLFERALFGSSSGRHASSEEAEKGTDFLRAHSMLRYEGVVDAKDKASPYGWDEKSCGGFGRPTTDPLLHVDTYFGAVQGDHASVWDLEASLHRGVDSLAAHGLVLGADGTIADADAAFAYLVAENIVDKVWAEVMGRGLTIANYFPRNRVQRDTLKSLTDRFVARHFSLKTLLLDIVSQPSFNLSPPSARCGDGPYPIPNLFDPWTISSDDPRLRGNGVGDGVFAISSRPLARSLHRAMQWPELPDYPTPATFEVAIGFFIKDADPGYRGLDFQGRLAWEGAYGACAPPTRGDAPDFIARLVELARATEGATVGDAVLALKDRLLGEPSVDPAGEEPLLEALLGDRLSSRELSGLDARLRKVCGVFVSSPQFMLAGTVPGDTRVVPKLTPPEHSYEASKGSLESLLSRTPAGNPEK
jgi:hypothetical protein